MSTGASTASDSIVVCPACNKTQTSLEKLNFHLSFACSSRLDGAQTTTKKPRILLASLFERQASQKRDLTSATVKDAEVHMSSASAEHQLVSERSIESHKYITCPGCLHKVLVTALDFHLEKACASRTYVPREISPDSDTQRKPPGLVLLRNFVTEEEEASLVSILEGSGEWKLSKRNGKCDMKNWGIRIDYGAAKPKTRYPDAEQGEQDLPEFLMFLVKRFEQYPPLSAWWPNECNANRYVKSEEHFLTPHFDDRKLSGEIICNVSLLSDCVMTFRRPNSAAEPYRVLLPRLSASVMSRSARYDYTHAISHDDLLGPKRISINFRQQSEPVGFSIPAKVGGQEKLA